jgi:acyl-CoA thioesterase
MERPDGRAGQSEPGGVIRSMMDRDRFSQWMGLVIDECGSGYCRLHYTITEDMLNGFGIVHGGILFSAADSAFAFACNSHGPLTVALDANIQYARPVQAGEVLTVEAKEIHLGNRTGIYEVRITNAAGQLAALFKGTSYRTSRELQ